MSTTLPPTPSDLERQAQYRLLVRYTSIGALVLCPLVIALPPRKFDLYTVGLIIGTGIGANQTCREFTGLTIMQRIAIKVSAMSGEQLPSARAREVQERLRVEKEGRRKLLENRDRLDQQGLRKAVEVRGQGQQEGGVLEAVQRKKLEGEEESTEKGVLRKLWMGDETSDWKEKRDQREKEALEEGKGYGDMIMDQVWEVWNWGKDKTEEIKEVDEKIVKAKKESGK